MQPFSFSYRCEKSQYLSVCVGSVCSYRSISSSVGVLRYFRSCLRSQKTLEKPTPTKIQVSLSLLGAELKKMEICAMWNHRIFHFGLDQASQASSRTFSSTTRKGNPISVRLCLISMRLVVAALPIFLVLVMWFGSQGSLPIDPHILEAVKGSFVRQGVLTICRLLGFDMPVFIIILAAKIFYKILFWLWGI
uniref:Uncharacterized protein orf191 n=1 Tax=Zea mays subsp. mays TaxID=381124 RepID=Q1KK83_MAIZE|nr:hypothetical protein [Zea mays subsp. mays]